MLTDQEILKWYTKGWDDEMRGSTSVVPAGIAQIAYGAGALDAIVGDDVRSVDYQTEEEILENIKRKQRENQQEEITLSDRKSATANLKDFCVFSMGDRESLDHFIEVTEWSDLEGYDITIEDFDGRRSLPITKGQLEALEKCVGKLRGI